jgi:hypothetical protein
VRAYLTLEEFLLYEALMDENEEVDDQEWCGALQEMRAFIKEGNDG